MPIELTFIVLTVVVAALYWGLFIRETIPPEVKPFWSQPLQTRDGRKVVAEAKREGSPDYPWRVTFTEGTIGYYTDKGEYFTSRRENSWDLVPVGAATINTSLKGKLESVSQKGAEGKRIENVFRKLLEAYPKVDQQVLERRLDRMLSSLLMKEQAEKKEQTLMATATLDRIEPLIAGGKTDD